jgi:hypothetical protein
MLFIYVLSFFLLFFLFCSIGYIIQKKMINGSCGGLNNVGVERVCSCETPCVKRRIKNKFKQLTGQPIEEFHGKKEEDKSDYSNY